MNLTNLLNALQAQMVIYFGLIVNRISTLITRFNAHVFSVTNPHQVSKDQVGLSQVENYAPSTQDQAVAGLNNSSYLTPRRLEQYMEAKVYTPLTDLFEQATTDLNS